MRLLTNARIYTLNSQQPFAAALAIEGEKIIAVGSVEELSSLPAKKSDIEDLEGRCILSGLCDAHIHLLEYGRSLSKVNCETPTRQECLQRIQIKCEHTQPPGWVLGHGWNHNSWPEGLGDAALLDQISQQHPIYLSAKSLHCSWVNSLALNLAGINAASPDPPGGRIGRDASGNPTGILYESAANLVERLIPEPDLEADLASIQLAQDNLLSYGITSVHDFDGWACYAALDKMEQDGNLQLRVNKGIPREKLQAVIDADLRSGTGSAQLRIGPLKLFSDGALGSQTAAMLEPYQGSHSSGMLLMQADELLEMGRQAVSHGIELAVHAIGDLANRVVLNGYENLRNFERTNGFTPGRHRIEHVQLIHPVDQARMAKLDIIASMQPLHATSDRDMAERYWGYRCSNAYAWQSLKNAGVKLIFGSDAPVEEPNPFQGIYAATTRQPMHENNHSGWRAEQCLNLEQALHAYTITPAMTIGKQDQLGKLAPAYLADLIVLEQDIFTLQPDQVAEIKPVAVMVNGQWVRGGK